MRKKHQMKLILSVLLALTQNLSIIGGYLWLKYKDLINIAEFLTNTNHNILIAILQNAIENPLSIYYTIQLSAFTLAVVLFVWSNLKCRYSDPGTVEANWTLELEQFTVRRYCLTCQIFKPDRSHHCDRCHKCYACMCHHCVWLDCCIAFQNRKYFLQTLFYLSTVLNYFFQINLFRTISDIITIEFDRYVFLKILLTLFFGVLLAAFLALTINGVKLVLSNQTQIENLESKTNRTGPQNIYDLTPYRNWIQVFGTNKIGWILPINRFDCKPVGNGYIWETNKQD